MALSSPTTEVASAAPWLTGRSLAILLQLGNLGRDFGSPCSAKNNGSAFL